MENTAVERWHRKSIKQRNVKSHLSPNPHLRHLNLNNFRNIKSLPVSKHGSRANELKNCIILSLS